MIRPGLKVAGIFSLIAGMVAESIWIQCMGRERWDKQRKRARLISKYSHLGLKVLGVEIKSQGHALNGGALHVGNHLSYLDVLVLASQMPTAFVTSQEIRSTPGLGFLCELGGCLFVERRSRAQLTAEVGEITEALKNGLNVTVFPEATSTNGESVLRFRRPLFQAAIFSGRPVQTFCLNYETLDGERISSQNRDAVCWYGDMDFLPHLWKLAKFRKIGVRLDWLSVINSDLPEVGAAELAERSHVVVGRHFQPFIADSNLS